MKYTQNEKIFQVTEETLIVGVDIASETHYARAFDHRGVEVGKLLKFSNDAEGFGQFTAWVRAIEEKCSKTKVMVGMEPTGHYWFNIAQKLKDHSMKGQVVFSSTNRRKISTLPLTSQM